MAELETAIKCAPTRNSCHRMQAIKALLLGIDHDTVAELYSVTRQTLLVWIKAFNAQGIDGLIEKRRPGRPREIPAEQNRQLKDLLHHPSKADVAHWTAKKFHGYLNQQLQIECGSRTVVRWLQEHHFRIDDALNWAMSRQNGNQHTCAIH